jgi:hypothetical protein
MLSPKRNPAVHSGGVGFDLPGGLISSWIADQLYRFKTIAAALAGVDAAAWAAVLVISMQWGWR